MSNVLKSGKIPQSLLERFLSTVDSTNPELLIPPKVGEDIAAIDVEDEEVVILKSDPITFATDSIAEYSVVVNANDIATSGGVPRWFLTTVLLPPKTSEKYALSLLEELEKVCRKNSILLCGGHTEITDAVTRPVVSGMLIGTAKKDALIDKRSMKEGDRIILTKGVAVEGTSIIAREFEARLKAEGVSPAVIETAKGFIENIGVVKDAHTARDAGEITALHDVTEGGLATALAELAKAGGCSLNIEMDTIPIFEETKQVCRPFGIDPLGLIGSGSLLITASKQDWKQVVTALEEQDIRATVIGEVLSKGDGITAYREGREVSFPRFEVDELTKLFQGST
jgi:hydrogenase expression/formation protein HypE